MPLRALPRTWWESCPRCSWRRRRVAVTVTVAQGTHGRQHAGPGDTFWRYRNFEVGTHASLIDWRRSGGSSHLFVREREWEAAHTVWVWIDLSPSMHFRSALSQTSKAERAVVLALALATLLSDTGERVGIPTGHGAEGAAEYRHGYDGDASAFAFHHRNRRSPRFLRPMPKLPAHRRGWNPSTNSPQPQSRPAKNSAMSTKKRPGS